MFMQCVYDHGSVSFICSLVEELIIQVRARALDLLLYFPLSELNLMFSICCTVVQNLKTHMMV